jgi:hypothetical protein
LDNHNREKVLQVLIILRKISDLQSNLKALETEKKNVYNSQKQIHSNMAPLSQTGDEGALRSKYLQKLNVTEDKLTKIEKQSEELKKAFAQSKTEAEMRLKQLEQTMST